MNSIAVIGGGFTGLTAAWDLARRGLPVTVLEADSIVGGLAGGYEVGGEIVEKFYHHWFTSDVHILGLIRELNLAERIVPRLSRKGFITQTIYSV
jgi:protoporphyrinogen oxidase